MLNHYELATDDDGEPFAVPPEATGWRVKRLSNAGGGRPRLMRWRNGFEKGQPMVLPLESTYQDLIEAAGPGRYRLELVGHDRRSIVGAPVGCTGDLGDEEEREDGDAYDDDGSDDDSSRRGRRGLGKNELLSQLLQSNARMTASALHQVTAVLSGAAQLVTAAHGAGLTNRLAAPLLPSAPVAAPAAVDLAQDFDVGDDEDEDEDGELDDEGGDDVDPNPEGGAPSGWLPELVQSIIKQTVAAVAPLVVDKLSSTFASLPLGSLTDWRKAAAPSSVPDAAPQGSTAEQTSGAPSASTGGPAPAPSAPPDVSAAPSPWNTTATVAPGWARQDASAQPSGIPFPDTTLSSVTKMHPRSSAVDAGQPSSQSADPIRAHAQVTRPTVTAAATDVTAAQPHVTAASSQSAAAPPPAGAMNAGAASQGPSTSEAVPAEAATVDPRVAQLNDHFTTVWNALVEPERMRAVKLIARLAPELRAALVAELSSLPLEQAVARAREMIRGRPPTP